MQDLAPGFRFYPTEEELVSFYLHNKLEGKREDLNRVIDRVIPVLDIYELSPWDLPKYSGVLCHSDTEQWFFFVPRQESEARGGRPRRITSSGYWKATGSPGFVYSSNNRSIGVKRTMVFYKRRAPNGQKTDWKINEYKAVEVSSSGEHLRLRQEFSLCRLYKKSKCLRAFDRRPPGVGKGELRVQKVQGDEAREKNHNPPVEMRTNAADSSSSGDHGYPYQSGENSNMTMAIHDDPLFDWEQLDWYYSEQDMQLK